MGGGVCEEAGQRDVCSLTHIRVRPLPFSHFRSPVNATYPGRWGRLTSEDRDSMSFIMPDEDV